MLFQGSVATALREVPGYMGYFGAFFQSKKYWCKHVQNEPDSCNINFLGRFLSGGFAGFFSWLVSYPQDIVKTQLQVYPSGMYPKYHKLVPDGGFIKCA